jgi:flagellar basal-body rod protein FlgB
MGVAMKIFSNTFRLLEQGIDYSSAKQKVIANNIANVETPGYKAKSIQFKDTLNQELHKIEAYRTDPRHFEFSNQMRMPYKVVTNHNMSYMSNGNSVDIDQEMAEMAKNQIYYDALIEKLNGKFQSLKTVIKGGRTS